MDSLNSPLRDPNRSPCANDCGSYGNDAMLGYCSICYCNHYLPLRINAALNIITPQQVELIIEREIKSSGIGSNKVSVSATESKNYKNMKQKCLKCDRKVGLAMAAIKCRCNGIFCAAHRLPEQHDCTFDFRTVGRRLLEEANPPFKVDKLNNI